MGHLSNPITKKDARAAAERLAKALGKKLGDCWKKDTIGKLKAIVGCWEFDCNPIYGGCVITEIVNEAGGVSGIFGLTRRPPKEFVTTVEFTLRVLDYYKKQGKYL